MLSFWLIETIIAMYTYTYLMKYMYPVYLLQDKQKSKTAKHLYIP